jgi:hypothetical protein
MKLLIIALLVTLAIGCGKAPDNTTNAVRLVTVSAYCIDANLSNPSSTPYIDESCDEATARAETHIKNFNGYCRLESSDCQLRAQLLPVSIQE